MLCVTLQRALRPMSPMLRGLALLVRRMVAIGMGVVPRPLRILQCYLLLPLQLLQLLLQLLLVRRLGVLLDDPLGDLFFVLIEARLLRFAPIAGHAANLPVQLRRIGEALLPLLESGAFLGLRRPRFALVLRNLPTLVHLENDVVLQHFAKLFGIVDVEVLECSVISQICLKLVFNRPPYFDFCQSG